MSHIAPYRAMRTNIVSFIMQAVLITTYDICNISPGRLNRVKAGLVIGGCICADDCFFDGLMDSVGGFHYD